jgi:hypothetical protein
MAKNDDDYPIIEAPEPFEREDAAEIASRDSEIDFDDEQEDDQQTIDIVEALEVDAMLDDPEVLSDEED